MLSGTHSSQYSNLRRFDRRRNRKRWKAATIRSARISRRLGFGETDGTDDLKWSVKWAWLASSLRHQACETKHVV